MYNVPMRRVRSTFGALGQQYSECVLVALGIQHAMRMCHVAICSLSGYSTSHKPQDFRGGEGGILNIKLFSFSLRLPETFLVLRKIQRDMIKSAHWSSCRTPGIPVRF